MKTNKLSIFSICFFFFTLLQSNLYAQCEISSTEIELEGDNISTTLQVGGDLWWNGSEGKYLFPKPPQGIPDIGVSAIKAGGIWMGGFDFGNDLKVAAQTDGRGQGLTDYWPGPNDDADNCENYDRFWEVTDTDINAHIEDYMDNGVIDGPIPASILAWPASGNPHFFDANGFELPISFNNQYAPFMDVNQDGFYDPEDGDYPFINCASRGVWWVFNDYAGTHTQTGGSPLGFRTSMLAYTYASTNENIENTTFYNMRFYNQSIETLDSAYIGLWVDFDLGCPFDDMIGCDTSSNLIYAYNQDEVDGVSDCTDCSGFNTYCEAIPMVGVKLIRGPLAPKIFVNGVDGSDGVMNPSIGQLPDTIVELGMTSFAYYNDGGNDPFPNVPAPTNGEPQEFYNLMSGTWPDGTPKTKGGSGYNPGSTDYTNYVFPGAPNDSNEWSMCSENFAGGDRKALMSFGPLSLQPDAFNQLTFAVVAVENVAHPCPDITPLIEASEDAVMYASEGSPQSLDGCTFFTNTKEIVQAKSNQVVFQPNPMREYSQILLKDDQQRIEQIEFFSSTGEQILLMNDINASDVSLNQRSFTPGVYFYVLKTNQSNFYSGKFIVQ